MSDPKDELEDLKARVTALEEKVGMEAGLRASVDRDLSDLTPKLTATHHLVQALSITQGVHTENLRRMSETQAEHGAMLTEHTEKLDRIRTEHGAMLTDIVSMLTWLIDRNGGETDGTEE